MSKIALASKFLKQLTKFIEDLDLAVSLFSPLVQLLGNRFVCWSNAPSFSLYNCSPVVTYCGCYPQVQSKHDHKSRKNCKVTRGH